MRPDEAILFSLTIMGYKNAKARPKIAIPPNAQRQPKCSASTPPNAIPKNEPHIPPAIKALASVARISFGKTAMTTAIPTLPYAASPTPTMKRAINIC